MCNPQNLDSIIEVFQSKGYDGYFMSQNGIGKLKEIIDEYLRSREENKTTTNPHLWLQTYLRWNGESQPYIGCDMWLLMQDNRVSIEKITIESRNAHGVLMKGAVLYNVPINALPTAKELLASVDNPPHKKAKTHRL